jgi:hypothetical protein
MHAMDQTIRIDWFHEEAYVLVARMLTAILQ